MRFASPLIIMCFFGPSAFAQQNIETLCEQISQYVPIDGVQYQPGAGEVPADINSVQDPLYGSISIPVELDLAQYFDRPDLRSMPGLMLEPEISNIEINQDGTVYYNGQEISQDIQRVCSRASVTVESEPIIEAAPTPPPPKPEVKPEQRVEVPTVQVNSAPAKKSSVSVFNGDEPVILNNVNDEQSVASEPPLNLSAETVEEKAPIVDENAIDVEELKEQDSTDDAINDDSEDSRILEGQYP